MLDADFALLLSRETGGAEWQASASSTDRNSRWDNRGTPSVDDVDGLAAVDSLKVDRRDPS